MADILNKKKDVYLKEKTLFLKELQNFHQIKGTPYQRLPQVDGKGIDLYLLYYLVTANGGWEKVNAFDSWDHLVQYFSLPKDCTNGSQALKYIYIRYLDQYERVHFLGEDLERQHREEEHEDEKRSQRKALRAFATQHVPITYNQGQHNVSEGQRLTLGMASLKERGKDDFERLLLSLTTPIPNEQDFAVNLCHMMSAEKGHGLNLESNPRIVDALLAHAGIFSHELTRDVFTTMYKQAHGVNISNFWKYSTSDKDFLELSSEKMLERLLPPDSALPALNCEEPDEFVVPNPVRSEKPANSEKPAKTESQPRPPPVDQFKDHVKFLDVAKTKTFLGEESAVVVATPAPEKCDQSLSDSDFEIFAFKSSGTKDVYGYRVLQILHIIRNLSFDESNQPILAKNTACIRFLLLCCHSERSEFKALAYEAFGNFASEFLLEDPVTNQITGMLLGTISKGLVSQDRAVVLGSLELLSKLCQSQENELVLQTALDQKVCESICNYLTAHDIFLLIMTLECLLSVSSLGEVSCNRILNSNCSLDTLMSLLTVEAQSFGQRACIAMQVIDASTGVAPVPLPQPIHSTPLKPPPPAKTPGARPLAAKPTPVLMTTPAKPVDVEESIKQWLKSVIEPAKGHFLDVADLHRLYVDSYARSRKLQVVTTKQLTKLVRMTFGTSVGPSRKPSAANLELQFMNLRPRSGVVILSSQPAHTTPKPILEVKTVEVQPSGTVVPQPLNSPILKAQLSVPPSGKQVVQRQQQSQRGVEPHPVHVVNGPHNPKLIVNGVVAPRDLKIEVKDEFHAENKLEALLNPSDDKKSVLSDLLEKDVNGCPSKRDVRIGDKGLELVLNDELAPNMTARVDEEGSVQLHIEDKSTDSSEIALPLLQQNGTSSFGSSGSSSFQNLLIEKGIIEEKPNRSRSKKRKLATNGEEESKRKRAGSPGQSSILQKAMEFANIEEELMEEFSPPTPKENGLPSYPSTPQSRLSALLTSTPRPVQVSQGTPAPIQHSAISSTSGPRMANGPKDPELLLQQPDGTIVRVQGLQSRQIMQQLAQSGQQVVQGQSQQVVVQNQNVQVHQAGGGQQIVVQNSSGQQMVVQNSSGQQMVVQNSSGQQMVVQNSSGQQMVVQNSSGQQMVVQNSSGQQMVVQNTSGQQMVVQNSGGQQIVVQNSNGGQQLVLKDGQLVHQQSNMGQIVVRDAQTGKQQIVQGVVNQQKGEHRPQAIPERKLVNQSGGQQSSQISNQVHASQQLLSQQQLVLGQGSNQMVVNQGGLAQKQYLVQTSSGLQVVTGASNQMYVQSGGQQLVLANSSGQNSGQQILLSNSGSGQQYVLSANSGGGQQLVLGSGQNAGQQIVLSNSQGQQMKFVLINSQNNQQMVLNNQKKPVSPVPSEIKDNSHVAGNSNPPPAAMPPPSQVSQSAKVPYSADAAYICEWRTCMRGFKTPTELYAHACRTHCPAGMDESQCHWERCDDLKRKRLSLMTHLYDRHCTEEIQKRISLRRKQISLQGKTDIPLPNLPPPHPGYAPNAAMSAIKRHALVDWGNGKDIVEEKEGPLTKSIRLTSALILKNIIVYSSMGKRHLKRFESRLTVIAMSNAESARTVSQILSELADS